MSDKDTSQFGRFAPLVRQRWEEMPFNAFLGIKVASCDAERVSVSFHMKEVFIGNDVLRTLHGGVIASVLDLTGGLAAAMGIVKKLEDLPSEEIEKWFARAEGGTIDLRVDYLMRGRGEHFLSSAHVVKVGNKVIVTRMELHNEKRELIAIGTGAYLFYR